MQLALTLLGLFLKLTAYTEQLLPTLCVHPTLHVCLWGCIRVGRCAHVCLCIWRSEVNSVCFYHTPSDFLRQGLSQTAGFIDSPRLGKWREMRKHADPGTPHWFSVTRPVFAWRSVMEGAFAASSKHLHSRLNFWSKF